MSAPPPPPPGDRIFEEILNLLKDHPEVVTRLTLDATSIKILLETVGAQALGLGQQSQTLMEYVSSPRDGLAVLQVSQNGGNLCGKGTFMLSCLRNTVHPTVVYAQASPPSPSSP